MASEEAKVIEAENSTEVLTAFNRIPYALINAEVASIGMDAQGIVQKAKLNKEIKELEPQIETLKAEVEKLSK